MNTTAIGDVAGGEYSWSPPPSHAGAASAAWPPIPRPHAIGDPARTSPRGTSWILRLHRQRARSPPLLLSPGQPYRILRHLSDSPTIASSSRARASARARELLAMVGLSERVAEYPVRLSGGQQQRVAIARALAMDPKIMMFDEVTSALDPELVGEVLAAMQQLARAGMTMVVVTHEMSFARDIADRIVFMDDGLIVEQGKPEQLLFSPTTERVRAFLLSATTIATGFSAPRAPVPI